MASFVRIEGAEEVRARLQSFVDVKVPREMRRALAPAGRVLRDAIRDEANFAGHGHNPYRKSSGLMGTISYRADGTKIAVTAGPMGRESYYAPFVIRGHEIRSTRGGPSKGRTRANPFVYRGEERSKGQALEVVAEGFKRAIEQAGSL